MEGEDAEIAKVIASSQKEQAEATPSGQLINCLLVWC